MCRYGTGDDPMTHAAAEAQTELSVVNARFMRRVFYIFGVLAALSAAISIAGKFYGASISMGGNTDVRTAREIVIGNNVIRVPENEIRFDRQRVDGVTGRLDLYWRWPQLDGYSREASAAFNNSDNSKSILFVSFEPKIMSRDMSGRFEPIYKSLVVEPPAPGPAGTRLYAFSENSGYLNETLVVGPEAAGRAPYVARCLSGSAAEEALAPCERDIEVGDDLSLIYRFPKSLLADWSALDAAVRRKAGAMLLKR